MGTKLSHVAPPFCIVNGGKNERAWPAIINVDGEDRIMRAFSDQISAVRSAAVHHAR